MTRLVNITEPARDDLEAIWEYVAQDNVEAANRIVEEIVGKFATLRDHPYIGREQDHLLINLRRFAVRNYLIFYQPFDDKVDIIRILHGSRDIDRVFERFFDSLE